MKQHRWLSFIDLSTCWDSTDPALLFEDCFGKTKPEELNMLLSSLPIESRVACIYAQLNAAPPTIESVRKHDRRTSSTPQLRTASIIPRSSSIASSQPTQVGMSSASINLISNCWDSGEFEAEKCILFLESIDALEIEALLWRAMLFADRDAIQRLSSYTDLFSSLHELVSATPSISWMASRFSNS